MPILPFGNVTGFPQDTLAFDVPLLMLALVLALVLDLEVLALDLEVLALDLVI